MVDSILSTLKNLLGDSDAEVRAQTAKVLGDANYKEASLNLVPLLKDTNLRVRYFAAVASGKLGADDVLWDIVPMLAENNDADPILRHGGIMALAGVKNADSLAILASHGSPAVRLAAVVALRRQKNPLVAKFLLDAEERVVVEAARAIHDEPITAALPQLAAVGDGARRSDPLARRVLNANFRLGEAAHANAVARAAGKSEVPEPMRLEALKMLADWAAPSNRDRVLGMWRPLSPRSAEVAREALHAALPAILTGPAAVRTEAAKVAAGLGLKEIGPTLRELARDAKRDGASRGEALLALVQLKDSETETLVKASLADNDPALRAAARTAVAKLRPADAIELLEDAIAVGEIVERQSALTTLTTLDTKAAEPVLVRFLDELLAEKFPAAARLDLVEAAKKSNAKAVQERLKAYDTRTRAGDPSSAFRDAMAGGNAERGRAVFFEKAAASCVRCHKVSGTGGDVGPELTKIGGAKARDYLLDALVQPSKAIAQGFETAVLEMADGRVLTGIVRGETESELKLVDPNGQITTVKKADIEVRSTGKSAMPEDLTTKLTPFEVRDLVEYLSGLK
jgi:quinoprotein glucose dehydrogenase